MGGYQSQLITGIHTMALLQVWFQTTSVQQISQEVKSHKVFGLPVHVRSYVYTILQSPKGTIALCLKNVLVLIKKILSC